MPRFTTTLQSLILAPMSMLFHQNAICVMSLDSVTHSNVLPDISNLSLPSRLALGPRFMPPGCVCKKAGIPSLSITCDAFSCNCPCDLTAAACDSNCCCDPECPTNALVFNTTCITEFQTQASRFHVKRCFEKGTGLEQINPSFPLRVSDTFEDAIQDILCVEYDNSAVQGDFYILDPSYSAESLDSLSSNSSTAVTNSESADIQFALNGTYSFGDRLLSFSSEENRDDEVLFPGFFHLFAPSDGGYCNSVHFVEFGKNIGLSCVTLIDPTNLQDLCGDTLSIDRTLRQNWVSKLNNITSSLLNDTLQRTSYLNSIRLDSFLDPSGVPLDINLIEEPYTRWNNSMRTCNYALKSIRYEIIYTALGSIENVIAYIDSLHLSELDTSIDQRFAVQFTSLTDDNITKKLKNNNLVPRSRSGNPGYIFESVTLGGILNNAGNSSQIFVDRRVQGLSLMNTIDGSCETAVPEAVSIRFGVNTTAGCSLSMTRGDFESFCTTYDHPYLIASRVNDNYIVQVPRWFESNVDVVGIFGNADPLDQNQWLRVQLSSFNLQRNINRTWISSKSECLGVASELNYLIQWTFVGPTDNPQAQILSVVKVWNFANTQRHQLHPERRDNFIFTSQVSWIFVKPNSTAIKPPRPVLLFSVPYDVFYPFQTNDSSRVVRRYTDVIFFILTLIVIIK